jgi:hypothetical protein
MKRRLVLLGLWLACGIGAIIAWIWMFLASIVDSPRAWTLAVSFDQTVNAATGGSEDETISSRAARGRDMGLWQWSMLCRLLDVLDPGHCDKEKGV